MPRNQITANSGPAGERSLFQLGGLEQLTPAALDAALRAGNRLVFYDYCISFVFLTLRRPSHVYLLRVGETGVLRGLPYTILTLLLGWWGLPWGIVYTPLALVTNLSGGCEITADVRARLQDTPTLPTTLPKSAPPS
jgi:hypothetical protein